MNLLTELQRRKVFKVGAAYLVVAWLAVQAASIGFPAFEAPPWALRIFILVALLGFPVALVMAWMFEATPEGVRSDANNTGNKRVFVVAAVLVALALGWYFYGQPAFRKADAPVLKRVAASAITDKSIAVLPFADFSQNGDQGWFADGLAEEILNALARTPDLQVSARTSSFKYKGSTLAIPQIAHELGVAHVLEGSVRSSGNRVRVVAQLIRASDGFHLWSQTYDRDAKDVIGIQEDLAREIAIAMQTSMDPKALADMAQVGTRSVEAYQAYLRGVTQTASAVNPAAAFAAYQYFEQARTLDPGFAAAHLRAAGYWLGQLDQFTNMQSGASGVSPDAMQARFRERIEPAIGHATRDADRYAAQAARALLDLRLHDAIELQRKVLAERPSDLNALGALINLLVLTSQVSALQTPLDQVWSQAFERPDWASLHLNYAHRGLDRHRAADQALQLVQRWPDDESILYQAQRALLWDGRVTAAHEVFEHWQQVTGVSPEQVTANVIPPARQASAEGRCDEVERLLAGLDPGDIAQRWQLLMLLGRRAEANQLLMPSERSGNVQALLGFLNFADFDPTPFPSLMRLLEREGVKRPPPVVLPFACKRKMPTAG